MENPLLLGPLGLNMFNYLWKYQVGNAFLPPAFIPLVLFTFLAEHVIGQIQTFDCNSTILDGGSLAPTVLNMLEDIPQHCPVVKGLIMDVSVGQELNGLPYQHLTFWLLRDMCCTDKVLFLSLSGSDGGTLSIYNKDLPEVLERIGRLVCSRRYTKQCHIYH